MPPANNIGIDASNIMSDNLDDFFSDLIHDPPVKEDDLDDFFSFPDNDATLIDVSKLLSNTSPTLFSDTHSLLLDSNKPSDTFDQDFLNNLFCIDQSASEVMGNFVLGSCPALPTSFPSNDLEGLPQSDDDHSFIDDNDLIDSEIDGTETCPSEGEFRDELNDLFAEHVKSEPQKNLALQNYAALDCYPDQQNFARLDWVNNSPSNIFTNDQLATIQSQVNQLVQLTVQSYVFERELKGAECYSTNYFSRQLVLTCNPAKPIQLARRWLQECRSL
jgi:hypothetical protein